MSGSLMFCAFRRVLRKLIQLIPVRIHGPQFPGHPASNAVHGHQGPVCGTVVHTAEIPELFLLGSIQIQLLCNEIPKLPAGISSICSSALHHFSDGSCMLL